MIKTISLQRLESAIKHAVKNVIEKQEDINKVNVFPVADKDTGTNIASTLENLLYISSSTRSFSSYISMISESTFDNARGNSGIILSMWFTGIAQSNLSEKSLTLSDIKKIFESGSNYLMKNFNPVAEGTIITFLVDFTKALAPTSSLEKIKHQLEQHIKQTTLVNPVLQKNKVVDAGALALKIFLGSFFDAIFSKRIVSVTSHEYDAINTAWDDQTPEHVLEDEPEYRFCTEAILKQSTASLAEIKSLLARFGDCDIALQHKENIRFHVHTNKPQELFKELYSLGQVKQPKVEDMLRQFQASKQTSDIALVIDSSADLPEKVMEKFQMHRIPLLVSFDDQQGIDGYTLTSQDFYPQLNAFNVYPMTSAPNPKFSHHLFSFLAKHYKHVLVITISSKMSSTFNHLSSLASNYKNVHLFDSKKNSGAHGWLAMRAAELIAKGHTLEHIIKSLNLYRNKTNTYIYLNNIKAMVKSGRLSKLKGFFANLYRVKPIISLDEQGSGTILRKSFSKQGALEHLIALSEKMHKKYPFKRYCILHVNDEESAKALAEKIYQRIGLAADFIQSVSVAVGIHAGKGALAISFDQGD